MSIKLQEEPSFKMIVPVILSGGSGIRLWPLSRQDYPKQLLKLVNTHTLLQETLIRLNDIPNIEPPIIVCNQSHQYIVTEQLHEIGIFNAVILLEPEGKNTAPATAMASLYLKERYCDPLMLVLPADHLINNNQEFVATILNAQISAEQPCLITFGIKPTRAESGYGYLKKGLATGVAKTYQVEKFIEKPNQSLADEYFASGEYYWNGGMFMFRCSEYLAALHLHAPAILDICTTAFKLLPKNTDILKIDPIIFKDCPSKSIDYAIMEKSRNVVMVLLDADWSDLGSWDSLWDAKQRDSAGNIQSGDIYSHEVKNSYLHSEHRMVAALGVSDHVVIETADVVFVMHKDYSQDVKAIVDKLAEQARPELKMHRLVYRPWGYYEVLEQSPNFQVKRLCINTQAKISLQTHQHRSEHWIVVQGVAQVVRGNEEFELYPNQSADIPAGVKHRLTNSGSEKLIIIEVQTGTYLGEDDIVRLEDTYGREVLNRV